MAATLKLGDRIWATQEGSLLAYNSENNNIKPLPFDFTRASSATRVNKQGLIETVASGVPRIDFTDANGALLLEPQRTNYITQSNDFSGWNAGYLYTTPNYAISPDGTQNASRLLFTGSSQLILTNTSATGILTGSIYIKGVEGETIQLSAGGDEDLITLNGEWQRLIVTKTNINGTFNINTFGVATARDLLIYAAQLEQGSYATSYIPTQGSAVTRIAEVCSQTPPSGVIGQTEGTVYAEAKIDGLKDSNTIVTLHNGSFSEYLVIAGNLAGNINAYIFAGGVQQAGIFSGTYAVDSVLKCAMAYKQNDVAFYINGVLIGTDSSATMASTSNFDVGSISFGNYTLHGSVKQAQLYNTRLSNAELATLTTI